MHPVAKDASFLFLLLLPTPAAAFLMSIDSSLATATSPALQGSLLQSAPAIGTAWVVSSALLTTYSTTRFLKYEDEQMLRTKSHAARLPFRGRRQRQSKPLLPSSRQSIVPASVSFLKTRTSIPRPALLTLYRFTGSLLLGLLVNADVWSVADRVRETLQLCPPFVLSAIFLFVANFCNSIALDRIGISLTYTSKCGIPLITVLLTLLLDGASALPNSLALLSLVPIAVGIAAASWSAPTFELFGFLAAMVSTMAQSALNVSSKRAIAKTGTTGPIAQRVMVAVGLATTMAMTLGQSVLGHVRSEETRRGDELSVNATSSPPAWLSLLAVTAYHVEYVLSFTFVKLVQPITVGTCDAVRRLFIILTGKAFFGGPRLTHVNLIGIALALMGALSYSVASNL